jgi:hypothetical protein
LLPCSTPRLIASQVPDHPGKLAEQAFDRHHAGLQNAVLEIGAEAGDRGGEGRQLLEAQSLGQGGQTIATRNQLAHQIDQVVEAGGGHSDGLESEGRLLVLGLGWLAQRLGLGQSRGQYAGRTWGMRRRAGRPCQDGS